MPFPESLRRHQSLIESTALPTLLLSFTPGSTTPWQSKIGGIPYFPSDHEIDTFYVPYPNVVNLSPWPKHPKTGKELTLLIQINFEEMPPLPSYPRQGLLQIFIDEGHWHDLGTSLKTIYHPVVLHRAEQLFSDFKHVPGPDRRVQEHAVSFTKEDEYMGASDFRLDPSLGLALSALHDTTWVDYLDITDHRPTRHPDTDGRNKIGGYHCSQNFRDPRTTLPEWHDSVLLLQLQDDERSLTWGDGGSAQFFIKRRDLENLDFGNLLFHWDST